MNQEIRKHRHTFSLPLFFIGFLLLVNPTVQGVDVLPDAIGYLLILLSLRPLRDGIPAFDDAFRGILRMFFLALSRIPALFIVTSIRSAHVGDRSIVAVFALVYAVLDLIFAISAFRDLFSAFAALAEQRDVPAAGYVVTERGRFPAENLAYFSYALFIVRGLCSFLPEALYLDIRDPAEGTASRLLSDYYTPVLIAAILLALVAGVIVCRMILIYFLPLSRDEAFCRCVADAAAERVQSPYRRRLFRYRRVALGFVCLIFAVFFSIDVTLDGFNILPDFLSAVAYFAALLVFYPCTDRKRSRPVMAVTGLYFVVSLFEYIVHTRFDRLYDAGDLGRVRAADRLYRLSAAATVVKTVVVVLLAVLLFRYLMRLMRDVLAYCRNDGVLTHTDTVVVRECGRGFRNISVLMVFDAVFSAVNVFLRRVTEVVPVNEDALGQATLVIERFGWFWIPCFFFTLLFFAVAVYVFGDARSRIHDAYDLDD